MAEELILTTPDTIPAQTTTKYQVVYIIFDWEMQYIFFRLKGESKILVAEYGGAMATQEQKDEATKMMRTLNTANLTTKSMQKRILEKLSADGKIPPGTVTGTPDPVV